jgi:hypothetical protein
VPESNARRAIDIRVLKYLAPVLLSTLACIQLFLGLNFELTPWKGGGFGMFSTVDSPGARSMRVYLETDDGELPTKVPSWLRDRWRYARSFPTDFRIRALADEMAAATWVYREDKSESKDKKPSSKNDEAVPTEPNPESMSGAVKPDAPLERVRPSPDETADRSTAKTPDKSGVEDSDSDEPYPRVKALKPGREIDDQEVVAVNAIRVEVWRQLFDVETNLLRLERLKQVTAEVPAR